MTNPLEVLNLPAESDDETIRRRYLELVREFPPEQFPERFAAVRAAYEQLRDLDTRLRYQLFEAGKHDGIDKIIETAQSRRVRRRVSLKTLLATVHKE